MADDQTLRIVLLGKTGAGKSSLANTICGQNKFKTSPSVYVETMGCCVETTTINGRNICLIDTPGFYHMDLNTPELTPDIQKCIDESAPGPLAFLLVLKVERYTKQEQIVVENILEHFSEEALKFSTVVFTHGENLPDGVEIKDWASENEALKTLIDKCGGRVHVFDNKYWNNSQDSYRNNQVQVEHLLQTIDPTVTEIDEDTFVFKQVDINLFKQVTEMDPLRIVLLGKVGAGKSSLANTIIGGQQFKVSHGSSHSKEWWVTFQGLIHGRKVQLTDTPGLFDTGPNGTESTPERCIRESAPGPHAFLLVFKIERFAQQEQAVVDVILKCFSEKVLSYSTVVFTHGDDLPMRTTVEEWADQSEELKTLVQKCGGRVHVFDNKYWNQSQDLYRNNQYQVEELLKTIEETVRRNGGGFYTTENLPRKSFFDWLFGY